MLTACQICRRQYDVSGIQVGEKVRCTCGELITVTEPAVHEARMQHCSSCGGKLKEGAAGCDYCGGTVSLADRHLGSACPECFARLRANARFCSECGISIRPQRLSALRVDARCPRCEGEMALCKTDTGHYTECTACGGVWLEESFFDEIVQKKDTGALFKSNGDTSNDGKPTPGKLGPESSRGDGNTTTSSDTHKGRRDFRYLKCPTCSNVMHRKNFGKVSGVIVDWCRGHGFWFDTEELEQIVKFVRAGGLDRARTHELARQKDRLRQIERKQRGLSKSKSNWTTGQGTAAPSEIFTGLGGSFRDQAGFSIWEAVREVAEEAFAKVFNR